MARSKRGRRPPSAAADRDAATVQAVNALLLEPRSPVGVRCRQRSLLPLPCRHRNDASSICCHLCRLSSRGCAK
jgi:hypothetical protein